MNKMECLHPSGANVLKGKYSSKQTVCQGVQGAMKRSKALGKDIREWTMVREALCETEKTLWSNGGRDSKQREQQGVRGDWGG